MVNLWTVIMILLIYTINLLMKISIIEVGQIKLLRFARNIMLEEESI